MTPRRTMALNAACVSFASVAIGSWVLFAAAHVADAARVDQAAGTWLALAQYAGEGTLYPPLYDGETFGGTRYMPLSIVLHAAVGFGLDDYLVAGKSITYALMAALLALLVIVLRRESCPLPVAAMLAGSILVTNAGLIAATGIRHDTLPVILQLSAVAIIAHSTTRKALLAAGLLCALALTAKVTAIWAPLTIGAWLLMRERSRLPEFAGMFLGAALVLLGLFQTVTRGRMTENVLALTASGSRGFESFTFEQNRVRFIFGDGLGPLRLVVLGAALAVVVSLWRRRVTPYDLAFAISLPILAVVLADRGAFSNQLLDLLVLSVVVLGTRWPRVSSGVRAIFVAGVLVIGVVGLLQNVAPISSANALVERDASRVPEVATRLERDAQLLSENPYVPLSLGQRPVVLDAFMLWSVAREHPTWRDDLVRRVESREFDAVLLSLRPQDRPRLDPDRGWYERQYFGPEIVEAILRNYRPTTAVERLWIYRRVRAAR